MPSPATGQCWWGPSRPLWGLTPPNRPGSTSTTCTGGSLTMRTFAYMMRSTTCRRQGAQTAASRATSHTYRSKKTNHNIRTARRCVRTRPCRGRGTHRRPGLSSRGTSRITIGRSRCSQMPSRSPRPSFLRIIRPLIGNWTLGGSSPIPFLTTKW